MHLRNLSAGPVDGPAFFRAAMLFIVLLFTGNDTQSQVARLPVAKLTIDSHAITVEVAADDPSRSYGLMNRPSLPPDTGMLFVFDAVGQPCFWMKNTPLPLSIAFIDSDGVIVNMADMQPYSTRSHCPKGPVRYALEMEQGWFSSKGVQAGAYVSPLPHLHQ